MLVLNEKRGYFTPTLWDSPDSQRPIENFEQGWMAGDHCNIGGSWEDAQMADISLAWLMSRFDALGVKFDDSYLYRQYEKQESFIKYRSLDLDGSTDKQGKPYPMDQDLMPRTWGEGKSSVSNPKSLLMT